MKDPREQHFDVIVIGAGHAGCEAGLACARMGLKTLMLTMSLDSIALPPCNPSIGGTAKGQVVREIDALGGEMGRNIDETFIQIKMLNQSKGPAVQALRAQMDRRPYMERMKSVLENQPNLELRQGMATELLTEEVNGKHRAIGITSNLGMRYMAKSVVVTAGTSLDSRIIIGDQYYSGGRNGEQPSLSLAQNLRDYGLKSVRWKTGTPPRLDANTIDWDNLEIQPGNLERLLFGHYYQEEERQEVLGNSISRRALAEKTRWWKYLEKRHPESLNGWLPQVACFITHTNDSTHQLVRDNLDRAPMFNGLIQGSGPRYCPSFESKVANFPDKSAHQFFLEPEGWNTNEVYLQGANTSLPEDVQWEMVRSIKGLEQAEIMRVGYAIEYDGLSTDQLKPTLENKVIDNLFLAGQVNGTSGYEEAAGQGLLAGINAGRRAQGKEQIWFKRSEAYLGVLVDDLINKDIVEPYRLMSARAEYRLLLRNDNADLRLTELGRSLGLVSDQQYEGFANYREELGRGVKVLEQRKLKASEKLNARLAEEDASLQVKEAVSYRDFLKRPKANISILLDVDRTLLADAEVFHDEERFSWQVLKELEIETKYEGYILKQQELVEKFNRMEDKLIPEEFNYDLVAGLRNEARENLKRFTPRSLGQARRLAGVNPADIAILLVWLERKVV